MSAMEERRRPKIVGKTKGIIEEKMPPSREEYEFLEEHKPKRERKTNEK